MPMSPNKASKLLSDYAKNNYNAYKTLKQNGYSEMTARKASKDIMSRADRVVKESLDLNTETDIKQTAQTSLEILGISREEVTKQLREIALNNRDYANALKVLQIVAKDIGVNFEEQDKHNMPSLNITLKDPVIEPSTTDKDV